MKYLLDIAEKLDALKDSLSEVPESEWKDFVALSGALNDADEVITRKLNAVPNPESEVAVPEKHMAKILIDKGFSPEYAKAMAKVDLQFPEISASPMFECSVCRGNFTPQQWRYHYHPCE